MQNRKTHIHILTQPERREQEAKDVKNITKYTFIICRMVYPQNILKHTNTQDTGNIQKSIMQKNKPYSSSKSDENPGKTIENLFI